MEELSENSDEPGEPKPNFLQFIEAAIAVSILDDCWGRLHHDIMVKWIDSWRSNHSLGHYSHVYSN